MAYEIAIDWKTAEVEAKGTHPSNTHLALSVSLTEEPDGFWRNAYTELALQAMALPAIRWALDSPNYGSGLRVSGFEEGDVDAIRDSLNSLVKQTNEQAQRDREEYDRKKAAEDDRTSQLRAS